MSGVVRYRTVLHGMCLLNGHHPLDSDLWSECPVNPAVIERRSAARRKAAQTRKEALQAPRLRKTVPNAGNQADTYSPDGSK
jgi:hypothetical protein